MPWYNPQDYEWMPGAGEWADAQRTDWEHGQYMGGMQRQMDRMMMEEQMKALSNARNSSGMFGHDPYAQFMVPGGGMGGMGGPGGVSGIREIRAGDMRAYVDPSQNLNITGGSFGGGGSGSWSPSAFTGGGAGYSDFQNSPVGIPDKWDQMMVDPGSITDYEAVVSSFLPQIEEQRENAFADAGARFGQTGFAASTPYANELGEASRRAASDYSNVAHRYLFDATQAQAQRDLQASMQNAQNSLAAWGQHGGWQMQGGLQDDAQDFGAWAQMGDWGQQDANRNMQQWMAQNDWSLQQNLANRNNDYNMMAQLMGSFF